MNFVKLWGIGRIREPYGGRSKSVKKDRGGERSMNRRDVTCNSTKKINSDIKPATIRNVVNLELREIDQDTLIKTRKSAEYFCQLSVLLLPLQAYPASMVACS